jgi:penicillin-binding protein 1A
MSEAVGRDVVRRWQQISASSATWPTGPALALGVSESTLLEMTGAYAGILNGGSSVTPYGLIELRLQGDDTPLIGQEGGMGERVISEARRRQLTWMMPGHQGGTGTRAAPARPAGRGQDRHHAGRARRVVHGLTADYVAGVWMGYDDNTPLTGVTAAACRPRSGAR